MYVKIYLNIYLFQTIRAVTKKDNTTLNCLWVWSLPNIYVDIYNCKNIKNKYFNIYVTKYWSCHEKGQPNTKLAAVMVTS